MKFSYLLLLVVMSICAMENMRFKLFPDVILSQKAQVLIKMIDSRQWQQECMPQIRLWGKLVAGSIGECKLKMEQYRLTIADYQQASQDPIVLQAWLADLPPDIRDIQVKCFFEQMCYSNKINILQLLESWGLCANELGSEFLSQLRTHALQHNYHDLAFYLLHIKNRTVAKL